ncbi:MASE1 domain-containing protein [Marinobacterium sp. AK62]|uniref:MASE1 domain-containing protein n=1 Tax=Marinobacterium alkalitolerans TaxID=1542925 RepID=A0ABS3Z985_9GAMM|nr:MASE1 domain-containing protein [Marinobacterium alkalitolerans]MBP0047848.1 MASE1 domain-containing protein [Marinobacterium alkalitolerans]
MIPANTTRTWLFRAVLVFVSYFLTGLAGLSVPFIETHITLIWAPTGIALAALLRWGGSLWLAIWLGAMGVNLWIGSPLLLAAAIACGNTLGPVLAAWLLRRKGFDQRLHNRRDLQLYLSVGVIGGMTISASNGVLQLWLAGWRAECR